MHHPSFQRFADGHELIRIIEDNRPAELVHGLPQTVEEFRLVRFGNRQMVAVRAAVVHVVVRRQNAPPMESLPLETYQTYWEQFDNDLYEAIDLTNAADTRTSKGGTSRQSIKEQIEAVKEKLPEAS